MEDIRLKVNDPSDLDQIWELSKKIFDPSAADLKAYHDVRDWAGKIEKGGLLVVAHSGDVPVGFVICYPKGDGTLHLWVGGVLEDFRGKRVWGMIYQRVEAFALEKGFKRLTLNTYQEKFPVMYAFALRHGFHVCEDEIKGGLGKSKFEKILRWA